MKIGVEEFSDLVASSTIEETMDVGSFIMHVINEHNGTKSLIINSICGNSVKVELSALL